MWRIEIEPGPGERTLRVRATDRTGTVHTEREQGSIPDDVTGLHAVPVTPSDGRPGPAPRSPR